MAKVLVIRTSSLGDVAMLVPVLVSVATKYPQSRFTVLTRAAFAPLFQNLSFNISVVSLHLTKKHKGIIGLLRIIGKVLPMGFSHVADEHDVLRSKIIRFLMMITGKKVRHIRKGRAEKEAMISSKQLNPPLESTIERYMDTFNRLGFPAPMTFSNFFDFKTRDLSIFKPHITQKEGRWIGIAPFSKHKGKIYPIEKSENIIRTLSQIEGNTIILLGGKEDFNIFEEWKAKYPNIINMAGKLNLEKELLLISYMDVVISMDSANMHLASLVNVPVVSIWGATHPSLGFYGYKQDMSNAVQIDLDCRPCSVFGDKPCARGDYACLHQIPESMIIDKVNSILGKKPIEEEKIEEQIIGR
jgi:ADP-heptose:LPS heptosyltransferase